MKDVQIEMRSSENAKKILQTIKKDWILYLLILPMVLWFALMVYKPMTGLVIAFKDYDSKLGIQFSDFVGFEHMKNLMFGNYSSDFWQAFRNTFTISLYELVFAFPIPIILALLFSEINHNGIRKITQTITYLPHFLSEVTITGIVLTILYTGTSTTGIVAQVLMDLGWVDTSTEKIIEQAQYFRPIYIITGVWKTSGYNSIIYFAAIMGISPVMYEALKVDGGSKWQEIRYVTIPGMAPTLIIMIIMRIGQMLAVGYERVLLLYSTNIYSTADVLSTFEIRMLTVGSQEIGAAAGIFNSVIGFSLVIGANTISRRVSNTALW